MSKRRMADVLISSGVKRERPASPGPPAKTRPPASPMSSATMKPQRLSGKQRVPDAAPQPTPASRATSKPPKRTKRGANTTETTEPTEPTAEGSTQGAKETAPTKAKVARSKPVPEETSPDERPAPSASAPVASAEVPDDPIEAMKIKKEQLVAQLAEMENGLAAAAASQRAPSTVSFTPDCSAPKSYAPPQTSGDASAGATNVDPLKMATQSTPERSKRPIPLPPQVQAPQFRDNAHRRAKWAQYCRTLEPAEKKGSTTEKCPNHMAEKIAGIHEKQYYFAIWTSEGSWGKICVLEEHIRIEANRDEKKYKWLTEAQLMDLYKDEECVKELVKSKTQTGFVRAHPEMPHVLKARQFKCLVEDVQISIVEDMLKKCTKLEGAVTGDAAKMLVAQQIQRTAKALGHQVSDAMVPSEAAQPAPAPGQGPPKDPRLETALKLLTDKEKRDKDRLERQQEKQKERDELKEKPMFKAKKWANIVKNHLTTCVEQIDKCKDKDQKVIPSNLATEYEANFKKDKRILNKLKTSLDSAIHGKNDGLATAELAKADKTCSDYKVNLRTFKQLYNRYSAHKDKETELAEVEADDAEGEDEEEEDE